MAGEPRQSAENRAGVPAGFYPAEGGRQRYWDGSSWTDRYADLAHADQERGRRVTKGRQSRTQLLREQLDREAET